MGLLSTSCDQWDSACGRVDGNRGPCHGKGARQEPRRSLDVVPPLSDTRREPLPCRVPRRSRHLGKRRVHKQRRAAHRRDEEEAARCAQELTAVGFEPKQLALVELESTPLRQLGQTVSCMLASAAPRKALFYQQLPFHGFWCYSAPWGPAGCGSAGIVGHVLV